MAFNPLAEQLGQGSKESLWYHFSIDDVFDSLIDVTDRNIPLFDHPLFSVLREMHATYGTHVALYLFYQNNVGGRLRRLPEVRNLRRELRAAGGWLHFGPHALDFETPPYSQPSVEQIRTFDRIYGEVDRFAGTKAYAKWIRLHFYSESYELAEYFSRRGVTALFSTDKPVGSHRMPDVIKERLNDVGNATYLGANFIRTQFRVEHFANDGRDAVAIEGFFRAAIKQYGYVILYSHEYELSRDDVRSSLHLSLAALKRLSISSARIT